MLVRMGSEFMEYYRLIQSMDSVCKVIYLFYNRQIIRLKLFADHGTYPLCSSVLLLAQRLYSKSLSMYNALNVKSRVRENFHAPFRDRVQVRFLRSTRPVILFFCSVRV